MDRCAETSKAIDLFGSGKHGYTEGEPGITPRTVIGEDALNAFQEEIVRTIEAAGLSPDSTNLGQLAASLAKGPPCASYTISGTNIGASTALSLAADTGDLAPASIYTLGSNKVTVADKGVYRIEVNLVLAPHSGTPDHICFLLKTTSDSYRYDPNFNTTLGVAMYSLSRLVKLAASDQIWVDTSAFNGGVGTDAVSSAGYISSLQIERVKKL